MKNFISKSVLQLMYPLAVAEHLSEKTKAEEKNRKAPCHFQAQIFSYLDILEQVR